MRLTVRALIGVLLILSCCSDIWAAEAGSRWWPFQKKAEAAAPQQPSAATSTSTGSPYPATPAPQSPASALGTTAPATQPAPGATAESTDPHWMLQSPQTKISWPTFHAPKFRNPFSADKTAADANRNSWVEKPPEPPKKTPLQAMNDGAKRVGTSTKNAWHKTVDALTPGESSSGSSRSKLAQRDTKPSLWQRMTGQDQELQGPQTVPEWMAQQRLDP